MRKANVALTLLGWLLVIPVNAKIVSHRGPDLEASRDFQVWVNGDEMFTSHAGDRRWQYAFCAFDFDRPVTVKVKFARSIKWIDIIFKDIQILDGKHPYSVINGFDKEHRVDHVTFENISVQGRKIGDAKALKLFTKYADHIEIK